MVSTDALVNALIGAVVTAVLSFVPFSPVLGGAVAAYLEGGDTRDGAVVGGISGAIAALPIVGILFLLLFLVPVFPEPGVIVGGAIILLFVVALVIGYSAAFGALGGVLGIYLREEYTDGA